MFKTEILHNGEVVEGRFEDLTSPPHHGLAGRLRAFLGRTWSSGQSCRRECRRARFTFAPEPAALFAGYRQIYGRGFSRTRDLEREFFREAAFVFGVKRAEGFYQPLPRHFRIAHEASRLSHQTPFGIVPKRLHRPAVRGPLRDYRPQLRGAG